SWRPSWKSETSPSSHFSSGSWMTETFRFWPTRQGSPSPSSRLPAAASTNTSSRIRATSSSGSAGESTKPRLRARLLANGGYGVCLPDPPRAPNAARLPSTLESKPRAQVGGFPYNTGPYEIRSAQLQTYPYPVLGFRSRYGRRALAPWRRGMVTRHCERLLSDQPPTRRIRSRCDPDD